MPFEVVILKLVSNEWSPLIVLLDWMESPNILLNFFFFSLALNMILRAFSILISKDRLPHPAFRRP